MSGKVTEEEIKRVKGLGFLHNKGTDAFSARVLTVNGKITTAQARCLAEAADRFGNGHLLFTTRLTVEVPGLPYEKLEEFSKFIAQEGLETGGTGPRVRPVVSCKGTTCQYGLLDSYAISEEIHRRFYKGYHAVKLPHKFKIAVGGCPNNCVKPDLNDVGIIGQRIPKLDEKVCRGCKKCEKVCPSGAAKVVDKKMQVNTAVCTHCGRCIKACPFDALAKDTYGFKIYIGGRWGKQAARGRALSVIFTDRGEALDVIEKAILFFKEQGQPGERFAETIARLGFENVEKELLRDDLLQRKEEILAK